MVVQLVKNLKTANDYMYWLAKSKSYVPLPSTPTECLVTDVQKSKATKLKQ